MIWWDSKPKLSNTEQTLTWQLLLPFMSTCSRNLLSNKIHRSSAHLRSNSILRALVETHLSVRRGECKVLVKWQLGRDFQQHFGSLQSLFPRTRCRSDDINISKGKLQSNSILPRNSKLLMCTTSASLLSSVKRARDRWRIIHLIVNFECRVEGKFFMARHWDSLELFSLRFKLNALGNFMISLDFIRQALEFTTSKGHSLSVVLYKIFSSTLTSTSPQKLQLSERRETIRLNRGLASVLKHICGQFVGNITVHGVIVNNVGSI